MSNKRYDICSPRKGSGDKTFWCRIGTAWENDKGIQLVFDALPIPDSEGRCVANLFEPKPREGSSASQKGGRQGTSANNSFPTDYADDDDVPGW